MKTKTIEHKVLFHAAPKAVYDALINSKKHAQFTGASAKMRAKAGTPFSCYGTYITGVTLDLVPGKRIVQTWRSRDWPKGHYSIVTFVLAPGAGGKTQLHFTHLGVPANDYADKNKGWRTHYWEPLKRFLEH
jgi:uncharacterized protein YndB with AHSA1/START domain